MRLIGKKGLLAVVPLAAAVVFWRVQNARRAEEDRLWNEEIDEAAEEGIAAARAPSAPPPP